jgi:hypothetical protein
VSAPTPGVHAYYVGSDKPARNDAEYVAFMLHNARDHVGYWTECDQPPCVMARAVAAQHADLLAACEVLLAVIDSANVGAFDNGNTHAGHDEGDVLADRAVTSARAAVAKARGK